MDDKVIVVTGAAQGIGAAYVRRMIAEGATVVAADRNFVPVLFQQLDENGDDIEMRILAIK